MIDGSLDGLEVAAVAGCHFRSNDLAGRWPRGPKQKSGRPGGPRPRAEASALRHYR
jgi:hypothetical protein